MCVTVPPAAIPAPMHSHNHQPLRARWLAHNGNLTNAAALRELELQGSIFHSTSDTEVIAYELTKQRLQSSSIEEAVSRAMKRLRGAYTLVLMSPAKLLGVRDPFGFRPLSIGTIDGGSWPRSLRPGRGRRDFPCATCSRARS